MVQRVARRQGQIEFMSPIAAICILLVGGFAFLWAVQSLLLISNGEKLAFLLRYRTDNPAVTYPMKVMVQLGWLAIIVGYPLLIGQDLIVFYSDAFHLPAPTGLMLILAAACLLGFVLIYTIYLITGAIEFRLLFSKRKTARRVIACFVTPLPLALMEEAVFRGVLLHALLQWLDQAWGPAFAVILSSAVFSCVHFIRRRDSKRKPALQPAIGLFFVGVVLGSAYVLHGQSLWLPVSLHAAGILAVELPRSFVTYKASPKWIGYRSFPHSGPLGIAHMIALTALVWHLKG